MLEIIGEFLTVTFKKYWRLFTFRLLIEILHRPIINESAERRRIE
jgi:hypothetical protein